MDEAAAHDRARDRGEHDERDVLGAERVDPRARDSRSAQSSDGDQQHDPRQREGAQRRRCPPPSSTGSNDSSSEASHRDEGPEPAGDHALGVVQQRHTPATAVARRTSAATTAHRA